MDRWMMLPALGLMMLAASAYAADPIEGNWKTESGETVAVKACDAGYCLVPVTGAHKGVMLGSLVKTGTKAEPSYSGHLTNPADGKTYAGFATVSGTLMTLKGCVMQVICKAQSWVRA